MSPICPHCGKQIDSEEHIFSRDEIKAMGPEDYKKNRDVIMRQASEGKLLGGGVRRNGDVVLSGPVKL